jgi:hypothetical protein
LQRELSVADKPILTIPVDDSEFQAFLTKWNQYHAEVQQHPSYWAAIASQMAAANQAFSANAQFMRQSSAYTTSAAQQWHAMAQAAQTTAQATAQINQNLASSRAQNANNQMTKNTAQNARNWQTINRNAASTSRWLTGISRMSIISGAFKFGVAGIKGAVAGYTTAALAYNNLANVNKDSRRLGMRPGQIQAFEDVYGPAGGSRELLSAMAEAKNDKNVAQKLSPLGITQDMVQAMNPEQLAAEFLKRSGAAFNKMGDQAIPWAQSMQLTDFASPEDMRLAGSYAKQPGAFDQMAEQYQKAYDRIKVDQDAADAATEFVRALKAAKDSLENNFGAMLQPLSKPLVDFTNALADWTKWAGGLDGTKKAIEEFGTAIGKITAWINSHGATWDWGKITHDPNAPMLTTGSNGKPWTLSGWWHDFKAGFGGSSYAKDDTAVPARPGSKIDPSDLQRDETGQLIRAKNKPYFFSSLENQQGLPAGLLQGVENIESHGGDPDWLRGPLTKYGRAMGPFQMLKATARRFGVYNRYDEQQSAAGAALYLKFLRQHYQGDTAKAAAGYNWGEGNLDKLLSDPKKAGNWRKYLPKQTSDYLDKLEDQGVDLSANAPIGNAKGDPRLQQRGKLNEDDFQIIDMSDEGKGSAATQKQISDAVEMGVVSGMNKFISLFKEGGGAGLREGNNSRASRTSDGHVAQGPIKIGVQVSTPAGASTNVTTGGLPR